MKVGTKSVLFGAHCFILHPWFVAVGWWKLFGIPWDPRLWVAFWVHDIGYLGKPNMDGPEGETHVELGAKIMKFLFGRKWGDFSRYHLAKMRTAMGEPKYASMNLPTDDQQRWYADVQEYLRRWVQEHRDGREDTWTPDVRKLKSESGVWQ